MIALFELFVGLEPMEPFFVRLDGGCSLHPKVYAGCHAYARARN
jgi:hypothetical protein